MGVMDHLWAKSRGHRGPPGRPRPTPRPSPAYPYSRNKESTAGKLVGDV